MIYTFIAVIRDVTPMQIPEKFNRQLIADEIGKALTGCTEIKVSRAFSPPFIRPHTYDGPIPYSTIMGPEIATPQVCYFYLTTNVEMPPLFFASMVNDLPGLNDWLVIVHASATDDALAAMEEFQQMHKDEDEMEPSAVTNIVEITRLGIEARHEVEQLIAKKHPEVQQQSLIH